MTVVFVAMHACADGTLREVEIPNAEWDAAWTEEAQLNLTFRYGQNEFQPKPMPSVSVGDVVILGGTHWRVEPYGYLEIT
mgnify:CR=1 FL=1